MSFAAEVRHRGGAPPAVVHAALENGELAYPVEEVTIAANLLAIYEAIEVIGSDIEFRHAVVAPTVKNARMMVAGG